jgi:acetyltransferase-like isoleucine patch superfamily enzyme
MMKNINFVVHSNVVLGINSKIGFYCYIGVENSLNEENKLLIGNDCNIRSHTVIYLDSQIGNNFATGHHVLIRNHCSIGNNVSIGSSSIIEHNVKIADNVRIHSATFIPEYSILEEGCWIGPRVVLTNSKYPRSKNSKDFLKGVTVGKNAKIGANSTILPGIKIGKGALIGAGSVVTKDVNDFEVVVGNPSKKINHLSFLPYEDVSI